MTRIITFCQFYPPCRLSSATLPHQLNVFLSERGFQVSVLTGKSITDKEECFERNNLEINRISYYQGNKQKIMSRIISIISFCINALKRVKCFKDKDICIVYTNPPFLILIAAFLKKIYKYKIVYVIYDIYPDVAINFKKIKKKGIIASFLNVMSDFGFSKSDVIVALSEDMKKYLICNKKVPSSKIEVISNWHENKEDFISYSFDTEKIIIFYGGNMGVCQDMDTIIDMVISLKERSDIQFVFAGEGIKKKYFENKLQKEKCYNYQILGYLSSDEYSNILKKSDILIVSLENKALGLGVPSKYYGYIAAGKPVLAIMPEETDIVNDIKQYNIGYHVKNGDLLTFSKIISNIKRDEIKRFGLNARRLFEEKYTLSISCNKYFDLINKLQK